jgi:hypothetical protein
MSTTPEPPDPAAPLAPIAEELAPPPPLPELAEPDVAWLNIVVFSPAIDAEFPKSSPCALGTLTLLRRSSVPPKPAVVHARSWVIPCDPNWYTQLVILNPPVPPHPSCRKDAAGRRSDDVCPPPPFGMVLVEVQRMDTTVGTTTVPE